MLLGFEETKKLLEKYGIPFVNGRVIENTEQGFEFARQNNWPVALKLLSQDNLHKVDKGLVKLGINSEQALQNAFSELVALKTQASEILVQKQVSGIEIFIGTKQDKSFGPVVSFGLGGIFVEVLGDVSFGICPVDKNQAKEMIKKIKGYKVLQGFRGQIGVDIERLVNLLVSVSNLATANKQVKEMDFNPIMAKEKEIFAVDAKIIV